MCGDAVFPRFHRYFSNHARLCWRACTLFFLLIFDEEGGGQDRECGPDHHERDHPCNGAIQLGWNVLVELGGHPRDCGDGQCDNQNGYRIGLYSPDGHSTHLLS